MMRGSSRLGWLFGLSFVIVGCRGGDTTTGDGGIRTSSTDERVLHELVRRNAEVAEIVRRIARPQIEAVGGGPPVTNVTTWPFDARETLAKARCDARQACGSAESTCTEVEQQRLASWPIDACEHIDMEACLAAVRTASCAGNGWALPRACAASSVCLPPTGARP